ncbi:MAG: hypothetical protein WBM44_16995 [Waterburya sp.]
MRSQDNITVFSSDENAIAQTPINQELRFFLADFSSFSLTRWIC